MTKQTARKTYYGGLLADGHTAVLQFTTNKDCLSPQLLRYLGFSCIARSTIEKRLKAWRLELLKQVQREFPRKRFTAIRFEID